MTNPTGQDLVDQIGFDANELPSDRCAFWFPLQCVFSSGDGRYCLSHHEGKYWPDLKPIDYERELRYDDPRTWGK